MNKSHQRGFTLIEVIIFIVVVAAGMAGILSVSTTVVKSSADPMVRKQAIAIAESLLEEILLKEYRDPNGGTNGVTTCTMMPLPSSPALPSRAAWDDVCDSNGYTSTGINDVLGASIAALSQYNIASVVVADSTALTGVAAKKITVTVTGAGDTVVLSGYRSDY